MKSQLPLVTVLPTRRRAEFSADKVYRYRLWREWGDIESRCCFLMLNPSVADDELDDPTIRRCIGFATRWGFGALDVVNIFAFRSTDPRALKTAEDPVGPDNNAHIAAVAQRAGKVVAAWGNHGALYGRSTFVRHHLRELGIVPMAFRITKQGEPEHPLYQRDDAVLIPFEQVGGRKHSG